MSFNLRPVHPNHYYNLFTYPRTIATRRLSAFWYCTFVEMNWKERNTMQDVFMIGSIILFFVAMGFFVWFLTRLK